MLKTGNLMPIHWASAGGFPTCVKKLLSLGADPNARTNSGATPLHNAASAASLNCLVNFLIKMKNEK